MLSPLHVFGLLVISAWLAYRSLVASAYSLRSFKLPAAHWSCHLSTRWFDRKCTTVGELKTLYAVHARLGPIVRLGSNEVSVVSQEGLKTIYAGGLDKSDWYEQTFRVYGVQNLVCTLDHKTHSAVRKMIAGLYTKSYLQHSEDLARLSKRIISDRLLSNLSRCGQVAQGMDVVKLFECVGVDFITGHIFGNTAGTDFLGDQVSQDRYFGEWNKLRESPHLTDKPVTESLYMGMCEAAISSSKESMAGQESRPNVVAKMYKEMSSKAQHWNMTEGEVITRCASEMVDHIIATQETNTITWTYILYRLSQRPELQRMLRAELSTLRRDTTHHDDNEALPSPASIETLPLLNATVLETLRLHAANPARMRRVVSSAGLHLHGYFIPPGTIISSNAYCLHRNEDVFSKPLDWLPERWLSASKIEVGEVGASGACALRKWFWAFGSGPRGCIGQHFALQS